MFWSKNDLSAATFHTFCFWGQNFSLFLSQIENNKKEELNSWYITVTNADYNYGLVISIKSSRTYISVVAILFEYNISHPTPNKILTLWRKGVILQLKYVNIPRSSFLNLVNRLQFAYFHRSFIVRKWHWCIHFRSITHLQSEFWFN